MSAIATRREQNKKLFGQLLIEKGVVSEDQLRIALLEQGKSHLRLGKLMVGLGLDRKSVV